MRSYRTCLSTQTHVTLPKLFALPSSVQAESSDREHCYAGTSPQPSLLCLSIRRGEEYKGQGHPTSLQFYTVFQSNQYCPTWLNQRGRIPPSLDNWKLLAWRTGREYQLALGSEADLLYFKRAKAQVLDVLSLNGTSESANYFAKMYELKT